MIDGSTHVPEIPNSRQPDDPTKDELRELLAKVTNGGPAPPILRCILNLLGGFIPLAGPTMSAAAGIWSEREQQQFNRVFAEWLKLQDQEIKEIGITIIDIMSRLDAEDDRVRERIQSKEYLSLVRKCMRDWSAAESEQKRALIRNLLSNAAASSICSDDVIRMFIDWIDQYTEAHFAVIGAVYNSNGITRFGIWQKVHGQSVREDSADADLFKLLIRDLSMGGIIRQHRDVDYYGNFITSRRQRRPGTSSSSTAVSAFDDEKGYELTELGRQFVHYTMNELALRIEHHPREAASA
jgi:hypothetical protein